jgi:hypothetical protein
VHQKIHGRRLMGGSATVAALAANFNSVALFNDSTIGHILRVDNWLCNAGAANAIAFFTSGPLSTLVARGLSLFSGEQAQAGSIYTAQDTNPPPFGVIVNSGGTATQSPELTPWFYLRPGFSLVIKGNTVNLALSVSLWWEDLTMDMLEDHELD